ncbi:unnamed protein product [Musa hybrid cultivar]
MTDCKNRHSQLESNNLSSGHLLPRSNRKGFSPSFDPLNPFPTLYGNNGRRPARTGKTKKSINNADHKRGNTKGKESTILVRGRRRPRKGAEVADDGRTTIGGHLDDSFISSSSSSDGHRSKRRPFSFPAPNGEGTRKETQGLVAVRFW